MTSCAIVRTLIGLSLVAIATPALARSEGRAGGKLLLTNGVTTIEGASGGGISTWSLIAGNETADGIGGSAHVTLIGLPDYTLESHGIAIGIHDRLELSYARQNLDTLGVGRKLGIGQSYMLNQDVFGAKLKLFGDAIYGSPYLPQVAIGVEYKHNLDAPVTRAIAADSAKGTDFYVAATKLLLRRSLLVSVAARLTDANQNGLLGFGGDLQSGRTVQFEGTLGYQVSRRLVVGAEYRTKPDNLGVAREDDWATGYAAFALTRNLTLAAAYVDLGSIATAAHQRGGFLSLQAAF